MAEELDVLDTGATGFTAGAIMLAFCVSAAKGASELERNLATEVIARLRDLPRKPPGERADPATTFNAATDVAIESANASAGHPTRATRRVALARALEDKGFALVPIAELADLVCAKLDLEDLRKPKLAASPPAVKCCPADAAAAGGCCRGDNDRYELGEADDESGFDHIDGGMLRDLGNAGVND